MEDNQMTKTTVDLKGNLSPLEEHFRTFDMGKANWSEEDYKNYATTKVPPSFLQHALKEDFKQRYKEKNNAVIYIFGNQGSGKSLLGIEIGLQLGKIFTRPLKVKNITFFDAQFHNKTTFFVAHTKEKEDNS
jgi:DNA replication protein DnaC